MAELSNMFDALYNRFLLRDVFGKVVPGSVGLVSIALGRLAPQEFLSALVGLPSVVWPLLYGAAWIVGFAIQQIPSTFCWSHTHTRSKYGHSELEYHRHVRAVRGAITQQHDHQQLERFIVIKESCGNAFYALLIAPFLWLLASRLPICALFAEWRLLIVWVVTLILLLRQHRSARTNEENYLELIVKL